MRMVTWARSLVLCCAATGLWGFATLDASAASLLVNGWTLGERVNVESEARSGWVNTAELDVTIGGQNGFSYCIDLPQGIGGGLSNGWEILEAEAQPRVLRAAWLVEFARPQFDLFLAPTGAGAASGVTQATAIAALQVAIWEVLGDAPGEYDLEYGEFSIRAGGASAGVMNLARGFLGELESRDLDAFETSGSWARHASRQDQIVFNPIPEPSSLVLFAAGATLIAFAGTRKRR